MSWIGGKKALRELIVRLFPLYYERYIEVFGGGGWVLFHKPPGNDFEVYNDFNGLLVNLYRCVRDKPEELMEALRYVLNAREDFDRIRSALARDSPASDVQRAAWFYQLIRYSYASGLTSFGSQPHDMRSNFSLIEQAHRRLAKVVIENKDFEKLLHQYDRPVSFFYLDPPYHATEGYYESLTEAFGNNLSLDKQSKDDTKEEERNINIKQDQLDLLWQLEEFRKKHEHQAEPSDWAIRMCEAFVARSMGFTDRVQWTELLRQKGETLFTFDWKSGSVSDHVVQWCKENNRNWRYSHLGELQVAHGGEWRKVDYFCRDGSETRVYFPPEPVQEQQLHALAEAPAVHLRDLLTLGLPDHDVYLVHAAEDVGWVPAADLPRLTAQGKEEFSALLDAKIAAIRPGPYGVELVLDGVNSQLLAQYDETLANSSRAEHAMELFL